MLQNLHVKNLALIQELEVDFRQGLNILTGETGAGKSIVLGSIGLALGGRYSADMLRNGADYGLVELTFELEDSKLIQKLKEIDIFPEEGQIVLSRKLMEGRSVSRINGETVSMSVLKDVASMLIDIHGQHEHQTLLHRKNHLAILDLFAGDELSKIKKQVKDTYRIYQELKQKLEDASMDEESRRKETALLEFEVKEIEEADLKSGEDEILEEQYRRMSDSRKLTECIGEAYQYTSAGDGVNASDALSRAIRALHEISDYDTKGSELYEQLVEVDSLLNDFNRELADYGKSFEFSDGEYQEVEQRLNEINRLKAKYGNSVAEILAYYEEQNERLSVIQDYEGYIAKLTSDLGNAEKELKKYSNQLSNHRKEKSLDLVEKIKHGLVELNFLDVEFDMEFTEKSSYSANGYDEAEFLISTNPGERMKALGQVASGGELSRIMLAIKAVMADKEDTPTLIFDEIDTGISGITAAKVAKQMNIIGKNRQVICITHLPQIAAMADTHYLIEKKVEESRTITRIERLDEEGSIHELARILGGDKITDSILSSAREMKELVKSEK